MNINELQERAYSHAYDKGFWDDYENAYADAWPSNAEPTKAAFIGQKLALIHSEVSEALEEVREGHYDAYHKVGDKPEGLPSELADICVRVADLSGGLGIDLQAAIEEKIAYNATRGQRHGKKF